MTSSTNPEPRRSFLFKGILSMLSGLLPSRSGKAMQSARILHNTGTPVTTRLRLGNPPLQPLDTMLLFERGDNNNGRAMTHEVISLVHQELGKRSFPWTLYSSLETHHEEGDACSVCSRLHKYGPGWSAGLHSEVFAHERAVALGVNVEMTNEYPGPESSEVIGLNLQAKGAHPSRSGIQVQDGGNHFENAISLNGSGSAGVDVAGKYDSALNAHDNPIRLNEGASIILDGKGQVRMRYMAGRIEFLNGDRCIAHIIIDGEDHVV